MASERVRKKVCLFIFFKNVGPAVEGKLFLDARYCFTGSAAAGQDQVVIVPYIGTPSLIKCIIRQFPADVN